MTTPATSALLEVEDLRTTFHTPRGDVRAVDGVSFALAAGETPRTVEVKELVWLVPARLGEYRILPADAPLVDRLVKEGIPR